jgi:hypothetical protein
VKTRTRGRFAARERVSFPELVWAHQLRQQQLVQGRPYEGEAEQRYRRFEAAFESRYGEIASAYWATSEASGAAVTVKHRPWIFPDQVRLHWATDWVTRSTPKLDDLLYDCESLAVRVGEVLRDTSQRVAMQWLFTVISHVIGFAETDAAKDPATVDAFVATQTAELKRVEEYYKNAAVRSGQIVYLAGALLGILPPFALAFVVWILGATNQAGDTVRNGFACFAAGALGALLSVMSRMNSGRVTVDWEFGKDTLRTMGSLRPVVGGIFGLALFFALKSGLVDLSLTGDSQRNFSFYILFAFSAGFSERLAQDMLLGSTLQRVTKKEDAPADPQPPPQPDAAPADPQPAA